MQKTRLLRNLAPILDGSPSVFKGGKHPNRLYLWAYHPWYRKGDSTKSEYCIENVRAYRKFQALQKTKSPWETTWVRYSHKFANNTDEFFEKLIVQ